LRPEAIGVERGSVADAAREVEVRILVMEPTGPDVLAVVQMGGAEITARLAADTHHAPGERCVLRVDFSKLVLFDAQTEERIV
jgi:multiple sugar transport system ATP-binding protein